MKESFVIQTCKRKLLRRKSDKINETFNVTVEVLIDPNNIDNDGIQWVYIKGNDKNNIADAKIHILALCSPEITEQITFIGFPLFIFTAFKEQCKNKVQRGCGVALSVTDDAYLIIQGTDIGVTLAISQIHHLRKLHQDSNPNKELEAALQFDLYVEEIKDDLQEELQALSNSLKKELLNILGIPLVGSTNDVTTPKVLATSLSPVQNHIPSTSFFHAAASSSNVTKGNKSPEIIQIDDTVIVLDSSNDEFESDGDDDEDDDDDDETARSRLGHDGSEESFSLPPNFVISEWIKVHYEVTPDSTDFVKKNDMLDHFKTHFDLPDDPDLANIFFDKLAVRIFPSDPNYRAVRTKKTKSKHGKRRLVCLRRRTISGSEKEDTINAQKIQQPKAILIPAPVLSNPLLPTPVQKPILTTSANNVMKNWNANRTGLQDLPQSFNHTQSVPAPVPQHRQTIAPPQPLHHSPPQPQPFHNLQGWLESAPLPNPRTQPQYEPRQQNNNLFNSIAKRVSLMANDELIRKPRPPVNPNLRHIVIDGSNVAVTHGSSSTFSCRGIAICIRFFIERGHKDITCFVPNYRKGGGGNPPSSDAYLLKVLEDQGFVKSTPSRRIQGRNIVCYDDRFIVELAGTTDGIILSNDQYRDLMSEDRKFRPIVEQQLLQYTIVGDLLMLPEDPLGKNGPSLEVYLSKPNSGPSNPRKKVVKVPVPRSYHPPAPQPVYRNPFPVRHAAPQPTYRNPIPVRHAPVTGAWFNQMHAPAPPSTLSPDQVVLCYEMMKVFPDREKDIRRVISNHPLETDLDNLMNYLLISDTG